MTAAALFGDFESEKARVAEKLFGHHDFNPAEPRGKDGKWVSSGEMLSHLSSDIDNTNASGYEEHDPESRVKLSAAYAAARAGKPSEAARQLRDAAYSSTNTGYDERTAIYRQYAEGFSKLHDDSPEEAAKQDKFLRHHAAHPKIIENEAATHAASLDRMSKKLQDSSPAVAKELSAAAGELRNMDFDDATDRLGLLQYGMPVKSDADRKVQDSIGALRSKIKQSGDYSWDMKSYGLYQGSLATKAAGENLARPTIASFAFSGSLFSDITAEKARIDAARGWHQAGEAVEKVGSHSYVDGWFRESPGLPADDVADVLPEQEAAEEVARTVAARRYARKVAKLEKHLNQLHGDGTTPPEWYNHTMNEEAGTQEVVVKVGPHGYVHGWIKVGAGETPSGHGLEVHEDTDSMGRTRMYKDGEMVGFTMPSGSKARHLANYRGDVTSHKTREDALDHIANRAGLPSPVK